MTNPLSPTAQAVLDAAFEVYDDDNTPAATGERHAGEIAAAAIRALVEQTLPEEFCPDLDDDDPRVDHMIYGVVKERQRLRREFLAVADELDGPPVVETREAGSVSDSVLPPDETIGNWWGR